MMPIRTKPALAGIVVKLLPLAATANPANAASAQQQTAPAANN
jgi:hypothetical protein